MRVLHVITGLGAGGAEHQLRLLLRYGTAESEVVALTNPGAVADAIRADGVPVHELGMRGNRDLTAVPRLVGLIRAGRFDIVHTHLYRACLYGRIAARLAGVRHVVATEHSLGDGLIEGRRTTRGVRVLYRAAERFAGGPTIAVSHAVERRLIGWGVRPDRIRVIPNGIDAAELSFEPALRRAFRARHGIAPDATVVGGLGRLEPTKRFDVLIDAVRDLPGATLLLVGDGSARAALESRARDAGVADRVVFAGAEPHARDALCAMDILASPSEQETFGLAVLEGLAAGLPVFYTTCPPLDGLEDPSAAPQATKLPADAAHFRAALARELSTLDAATSGAPRRYPVPPAVTTHDIKRLATTLDDLYADLAPHHDEPQPAVVTGEGR
jgi:glycosyltransferase involved in cell wall biosynthesis